MAVPVGAIVGAMVAVWPAIAAQVVQLVKLVQFLVQSESDRQAGV